MAITRGATVSIASVAAAFGDTDASISHTVDSGTTLLMMSVMFNANESVSGTPQWNGSENLTLVDATTSSGIQGDMAVETWALVSPTATTGTITVTLSVDQQVGYITTATNYIGTSTDSVAAATNFLEEDVIDSSGGDNSTSFVSAGSAGNCLYAVGGFKGGDGGADNITVPASFFELYDGVTGAGGATDIAGYMCDALTGSPLACAWTWPLSDENAAHYIEIVAGADTASDINYTGTGRGILRGLARGVG